MNNFRSKSANNRYSGSDSQDYGFNQYAGAQKVLGPILGRTASLGALGTAKGGSNAGILVAIYNNSAVTAFAKTGTSAVTAPTDGTNGICLPPMAYTIIALCADTHVICNAATCFGYEIVDDLMYNPKSGVST